jgi:hypothetical protein
MSWGKHKDCGKGGKLGHSNMAYWGSNDEAKDASRKYRRVQDRAIVSEGLRDAAEPDRVEPYRRVRRRTPDNPRASGRHCPICAVRLRRVSTGGRRMKCCVECQAHFTRKICSNCGAAGVWENKGGAGCQHCGVHGKKSDVLESDDEARGEAG